MELSKEECLKIERERIISLVKTNEGTMTIDSIAESYASKYEGGMKFWKEEFVSTKAYFTYGFHGVLEVSGDTVTLCKSAADKPQPNVAPYLSRLQFSPFYGFSDGEKSKGVSYRVWRFEVDSVLKEGFYVEEVIAEQVRRSLQGEAKSKIVGIAPGSKLAEILERLDQFYSDSGTATGEELLTAAYGMKQREYEEVSVFASRLDNQLRMAKEKGTELIPDEQSLEKHLRLLFWEGLPMEIKDKTRHKKDSCQTFRQLIDAARHGEREAALTKSSKRVARQHQSMACETKKEPTAQTDGTKPAWVKEICESVVKELTTAFAAQTPVSYVQSTSQHDHERVNQGQIQRTPGPPRCFRCGQLGHVKKGCRNPPAAQPQGNEMLPPMRVNLRQ